jgi:hypothetical protein
MLLRLNNYKELKHLLSIKNSQGTVKNQEKRLLKLKTWIKELKKLIIKYFIVILCLGDDFIIS